MKRAHCHPDGYTLFLFVLPYTYYIMYIRTGKIVNFSEFSSRRLIDFDACLPTTQYCYVPTYTVYLLRMNDLYILYTYFVVFFRFRMEETVRTLLQYKSKFEQLKQERHSVANSYEVSILKLKT